MNFGVHSFLDRRASSGSTLCPRNRVRYSSSRGTFRSGTDPIPRSARGGATVLTASGAETRAGAASGTDGAPELRLKDLHRPQWRARVDKPLLGWHGIVHLRDGDQAVTQAGKSATREQGALRQHALHFHG